MNNSIIHGFEGQHSKTISITMTQDKNTVSLIYADNGLGLSTKSKSKIFEPFFTTKRNEGGSGLGMHLVFNIVTQALKGNIEILNTQDKGLSYKITSPS